MLHRTLIGLFAAVAIGVLSGSVFVANWAMHVYGKPSPDPVDAQSIARDSNADWSAAEITASDGVILRGWLFTPHQPNGGAIILLHGAGDSRLGVLGHAGYLLAAGYTVLTPDSRGHGASGGDYITYGVKEAADVHMWASWLLHRPGLTRLYGMGESMGAAILLQSLATEPRWRAVVAECPFATFDEIAYERMTTVTRGIPRASLWPIVQTAFLYSRLRYGVDLHRASPLAAIRATHVPTLLIHGTADDHIPYRNSVVLHDANPSATTLWLVPGAVHVSAMAIDPQLYIARVTSWFHDH